MSEAEYQSTDILLPSARVYVFSKDSETLESAAAMQGDWRFARVTVKAVEGDVGTAIATFQNEKSPNLIIIQTDEIDDSFTEQLGALSAYCDEGTAAIVVGPVNDVYLYRQLIEMGVSDYLVRPIKADVLSKVIAKALIARLGVSGSRLIAVSGAKGGVGTSTLTQLAAWIMSEKLEQKTVLLDAAGGRSPLSVGMGFDPSATLLEIARAVEGCNEDALNRMLFEVNDKLTVLASGAEAMLDSSVSAAQFEAILDNLMAKSPMVLVDLSSAESSIRKAVLARANHIIAVTSPTVTSLRFCRSFLKEISDIRGGKNSDVSLIINQQGLSKAHEVPAADIAEALEFKPSALFPYTPALFLKHESKIGAMLSDKDGEALVTAFLPILRKFVSGNAVASGTSSDKNSGFLGGFLNKFTSK